ncbi:MAG: homogentisate 1,2-dioxygenase [Bacteroidetes bacterium]|nr:homogentisate 1,2-dioxygenase [Bacteroidota bacterium]MBS1738945.1 homogentisate 1,2-dioxygenase [Bacteroidota bacterium]
MPFYHSLGKIPDKRHIVFRQPNGKIYQEELVGTQGFSSLSSLVYHLHPPTCVRQKEKPYSVKPKIALHESLDAMSFKGFDIPSTEDYVESRKTLFVNGSMNIGLAAPMKSTPYFFKNADADEMLFVHKGSGTVYTMYGQLKFQYGDYIIIPRGTVYKIEFDTPDNRLLFIEAFNPIFTPKRYRNEFGQMLEHSPFCERDIKRPQNLETFDEKGNFDILIKKKGMIYPYTYIYHPFDVVGWDGYHYPYIFSIFNFEPITGRIHLPPPIHQTFENIGFVVCSFVPRMYDYHPQAIPAPYHHSNIDSDEILYYVDGDFMSRNNIEKGQLTMHPGGLPHGPHPGAIERSIGKKETQELAVMIDPFESVMITEEALKIDVKDYYKSWLSEEEMS